MDNKKEITIMFSPEKFKNTPIVGILRNHSLEATINILEQYLKAGLTTIEITMNTANAAEIIRAAVNRFGRDLNIGAGTVVTEEELDKALEAGATFIVTPIVNEKVIMKAAELKVPVFPGAYTPTEVYKAWILGAEMVKIFPTTFIGPAFIKELKAPLNKVKMLATGGVTLINMVDFFKNGSDAVAMASQLFPKDLIENKKWDLLFENFKTVEGIYRKFIDIDMKNKE